MMVECNSCKGKVVHLEDRGVHKAIICACGKWIKFATKDEIKMLEREAEEREAEKNKRECSEIEAKLSFSRAFAFINNPVIKDKIGMRLPAWKEDVSIRVQFPDENSKMTAPYLYVKSRFGCVAWMPTQIELFSREWIITFED